MSDLGTGAPFVQGDIVDYSSISSGALQGINIAFGVTERGEVGKPILCRTQRDYFRHFGGLLPDSNFPYMALRALAKNGRYYIIPVGHYTDVTDPSTLSGTKATATVSAVLETVTNSAEFTAKSAGPWANSKLKVTVVAAKSGDATKRDIIVELAGYSFITETIKDVPANPTADDKADFNRRSKLVQLGTVTVSIPVATATFSGGVRNVADIVDADYIGSSIGKTGIYAADTIRDAVRIMVPEKASGAIDNALAAYVDMRKDLAAVVRTPLGLDAETAIEYRNGEGSYTHDAVDSWRTFMFTGGLVTADASGREYEHSELLDIMVNFSNKDASKSVNYSAAGLQRGIITNVKGPVVDFGSASQTTEYGQLYSAGINAVISDYDQQLGNITRIDGNRTLWKKATLLQKLNIAEYLIWLYKMINQKVKWQQYEPNDPIMWSYLYSEIKPILNRSVEMRAISEWKYVGDQFAQSRSEATFNTQEDLDNGIYKFKPLVKPIGATEWIGFEIGVANSGVNFEDIIE